MKLFVVFVCIFGFGVAEHVKIDWDHPIFTEFRDAMIPELRQKLPEPINRCNRTMQMQYIQEFGTSESAEMLNRLHNLFLASSEDVVVGLDEVLFALRSRKLQTIVMSAQIFIKVYKYKNYLTGSNHYEFCHENECNAKPEMNNGLPHGTYFMRKCVSFGEFVFTFYRRFGTTVVVTKSSNEFFRAIGQIAGFTRNNFKIRDATPPRTSWKKDKKYSGIYLYRNSSSS